MVHVGSSDLSISNQTAADVALTAAPLRLVDPSLKVCSSLTDFT